MEREKTLKRGPGVMNWVYFGEVNRNAYLSRTPTSILAEICKGTMASTQEALV